MESSNENLTDVHRVNARGVEMAHKSKLHFLMQIFLLSLDETVWYPQYLIFGVTSFKKSGNEEGWLRAPPTGGTGKCYFWRLIPAFMLFSPLMPWRNPASLCMWWNSRTPAFNIQCNRWGLKREVWYRGRFSWMKTWKWQFWKCNSSVRPTPVLLTPGSSCLSTSLTSLMKISRRCFAPLTHCCLFSVTWSKNSKLSFLISVS